MKKISMRRLASAPLARYVSTLPASPRMQLMQESGSQTWTMTAQGPGVWREEAFLGALQRWLDLIPWLRASFTPEARAICIHESAEASVDWDERKKSLSASSLLWHLKVLTEASGANTWKLELRADARLGDPALWQEWLRALFDLYEDRTPRLTPLPSFEDLAARWKSTGRKSGPAASARATSEPLIQETWTWSAPAAEAWRTLEREQSLSLELLACLLHASLLFIAGEESPTLLAYEIAAFSSHAARYPGGQVLSLPSTSTSASSVGSSWQQLLAHFRQQLQDGSAADGLTPSAFSCAWSLIPASSLAARWTALLPAAHAALHVYFNADPEQPFQVLARPESMAAERLKAFLPALDEALVQLPRLLKSPSRGSCQFPEAGRQLYASWNQSARSYPLQMNLSQLLDSKAEAGSFGSRIALETASESLTYQELYARSRRLAAAIQARGIGPGDLVGLALPRSPELIVALLAILRTGAAYVPLDPAFPEARLQFMLADAKVKLLIASPELLPLAPPASKILSLEEASRLSWSHDAKALQSPAISSRATAYVIYTSGSTGQPKGVMLSHYSVINFLLSMCEEPGMDPDDSILAVTTLSFDIAVLEIFLPLLVGARIYLASQDEARDGHLMRKVLESRKITHFQATPSTYRLLLDAGWRGSALKKALAGGEAFPASMIRQLLPLVPAVWNMYGPTETTVWSSVYRLRGDETLVPIGRPIANTRIYVLDEELRLLPPGKKGEIYIAGDGLALGYLERPELTAERFLELNLPGLHEKVYRTGDIGRYRWDGVLEIFGRADQQVKLRGYRLELGEIEAVLSHLPGVEHAVVLVQTFGEDDQRLVAYVESKKDWDEKWLRQEARLKLPSYMLPQHYMQVTAFPLLPNGKIDRKKLPHPLGIAQLPKESTPSAPELGKKPLRDLWPLTPSQARMLYVEQLDPGTTVHNLLAAWTIEGTFDRRAFTLAFQALVEEHESLRARLSRSGEGFEILAPFTVKLPTATLEPGVTLEAELHACGRQTLDLFQAPNFRAGFIEEKPQRCVFYLLTHHIFWDGFSYAVFWRQLQKHYVKALGGALSPCSPLAYNFSHYAEARKREVQDQDMAEQLAFWQKRMDPLPEPLELAYDSPRPKDLAHRGATVWIPWDNTFDQKLQDFVRTRGCSLFQLLLASLFATLHRLSGQEDLVVGTPIHGRQGVEVFELLGNFINVTALRARCQPDLGFDRLLEEIKRMSQEAMAYADLPFEQLVAALRIPRDTSRTPLYTCMLFFQDHSLQKINLGDARVAALPLACQTVDTDLVFSVERYAHETFACLNYRSDLWEAGSARAMALALRYLLEAAIEAPTRSLGSLPLLPLEEAKSQLPSAALRSQQPAEDISGWLSQVAAENPKQLAVRELDLEQESSKSPRDLTFAELESRALQLASVLAARGVQRGSVVGVCLNRELPLIVTLRAILRLGAAYLPLDPLYPAERLQFMVEDARCTLVVSALEFADFFGKSPTLLLDRDRESIERASALPAEVKGPTPEDLAYIIYTSGSTGKPKGVEISHRALVHFLQAISEALSLPKGLRTLAITTISFDISILEIFSTLTQVGTVVLVAADRVNDGAYLSEALEAESIDLLQATPATWRLLLGSGWVGKPTLLALTGGEALTRDLARELQPRVGQLWNVYGPTEATVWATAERIVDPEAPICIGKVLPGYEALILDARGQPLPQGTIGQLYLAGPALARGYRFRPELSEERFIPHRFQTTQRMYDTGDLVRSRPDGRLEYISRRDNQVKLRGYRIELGEIEACMMTHPSVRQAVCVVRELGPGDQRLLAYAVLQAGAQLDLEGLQQHLGESLPKYMLPQQLVQLERFPLTGSGKIDKKALPAPVALAPAAAPAAAEEALEPHEVRIAAIFSELLGRSGIRASDNFFDLGGHSLLALRALHRCQEELNLQLKIRDLLLLNVAQLAALVVDEGTRRLTRSPGERR